MSNTNSEQEFPPMAPGVQANKPSVLNIGQLDQDEEEEKYVTLKEIQDVQKDILSRNNFPIEHTSVRNVLIVGKTRSGKSTAIGVLKNPCFNPNMMSIFSDTFDPKFSSFAIEDKRNGKKFTVNVVDTPGLMEVKPLGKGTPRNDQVILDTIKFCLINEITKINLLLIFVSFELGVNSQDTECFKQYFENFYHENIVVGICITRMENKTEDFKKHLVEQLKQHSFFAEKLRLPNVKVLFMGCASESDLESFTKIQVSRTYKKVAKMREALFETIIDVEHQVPLMDLPINGKPKQEMIALIQSQFNILNKLAQCKDFELGWVYEETSKFAENMTALWKKEYLQASDQHICDELLRLRKETLNFINSYPSLSRRIRENLSN